MGILTFLTAWVCIGMLVSTIWSKYVNGQWWSGVLLGLVVQVVIWPVIGGILIVDVARGRSYDK